MTNHHQPRLAHAGTRSSSCTASSAAPSTPAGRPPTRDSNLSAPLQAGMHVAGGELPGGFEQQLTDRRTTAADHDLIGVERVDRVGDADSDGVRPAAHRCERGRVSVPSAATTSAPAPACSTRQTPTEDRVGMLGGSRRAKRSSAVPEDKRLERARLREVFGRGRYVGIAGSPISVIPSSPAPPLPPRKMRPSITTPASDTRADRDDHEVARRPG